jgi:hypothetical protein
MTYDAKRRSEVAARRAALLFERQQESDRRIAEEGKRHNDMLAKTTRLREQRLERDAADSEAAKPKGRRPRSSLGPRCCLGRLQGDGAASDSREALIPLREPEVERTMIDR